MTKLLSDYSGPFDPDFSHEKLSREALLKILKENSDYLRRLDGTWYIKVMDKCGNDIAFECDYEIWVKFILHELRSACKLMNIKGNDVETLMKAMQSTSWMWVHNRTFELKSKNHGIITYRNCQTLQHLEKEGMGRERQICHILEKKLFELTAQYFNPRIKVNALKLPPREKGSDISCQWEYKLEE